MIILHYCHLTIYTFLYYKCVYVCTYICIYTYIYMYVNKTSFIFTYFMVRTDTGEARNVPSQKQRTSGCQNYTLTITVSTDRLLYEI